MRWPPRPLQSIRNLLFLLFLLIVSPMARGARVTTTDDGAPAADTMILPRAQKQGIEGRVLPMIKLDAVSSANILPLMAKSSSTAKMTSTPASPTCTNTTFVLRIPAPAGAKIELKKIQTSVAGYFLLSGNLIFPDGHHEGILLTMDNNGFIGAQQTLFIDSKPTTIHDAKALSNGNVFIVGTIDDGTNTIFSALVNFSMTLTSARKITLTETPQKLTADIIDVSTLLEYSIGVQLTNSGLGILLNDDLSIKWTSRVDLPGLVDLVGFSDYTWAPLALIANCVVGGKNNIVLNELNANTGLINFSYTMEDGTWEAIGLATTQYDAHIRLLGVRKNAANQFEIFRDNIASSPRLEFRHRYTLPEPIDFSVSAAMDNAGDAMGISLPASGKLILIKQFAYYQTVPEHIREYNVPVGSAIKSISRSFDGGYLFGLNKSDLGEIMLIKTDSSGILPTCGYTDLSSDFTEELGQPLYPSTGSAIVLNLTAPVPNPGFTSLSVSPLFDCRENFCPSPPVNDTCLASYTKLLRSNSYSDGFTQYFLMRNNVHLVNTRRLDRITGTLNTERSGLKLFDEQGNFIKAISVSLNNNPASIGIKKVTDSTFLMQSYSTVNGIPVYTFTLMNDDLAPIWSKTYKFWAGFNFTNDGTLLTLHRDVEGSYYFAGVRLGFNESAGVMAAKLDANGDLLWQRMFAFNGSTLIISSLASTPSSLIVLGEGNPRSFTLRLDKETGDVLNGYQYDVGSDGGLVEPLLSFDNDRIIYAGKTATSNFLMGIFDTLGKPVIMKTIPNSSIPRASTLKADKLYVNYNYYNGTSYKDVLLKTDSALNIEFYNEYDPSFFGYPIGMGVGDNGSIYMGGDTYYEQYFDPFIRKYEPNGKLGTCAFTSGSPALTTVDPNATPLSFTEEANVAQSIDLPLQYNADINGQSVSGVVCSSTPQCDLLTMTGPATVCQLNSPYNFAIRKTPGCTVIPQSFVDTSLVRVTKITDTSLTVQFKKAGTPWIKMKLDAGCKVFWDSLQVNVSDAAALLSLGKDTTLCPGRTILLNAKRGFNSYQWQDNSTDSTYMVMAPGTYWIKATDACADVFRDTIIVSPAQPIVFTPLVDRSKCNNDTVRLSADYGFTSYAWSPDYNISSVSQQTVIVNPQRDTDYFLTAQNAEGCFIHDTVTVLVMRSPAIQLGNDTSFCQGQAVLLDAGGGFSSYAWSSGEITRHISVSKAGEYSVIASTNQGCRSFDTLRVVTVYANPVVSLDKNPGLCMGSSRELDAGSFSKYAWQDGSTARNFVVQDVGKYYVQVTDNNNCVGSDTTIVATLYSSPAKFLPADTSICNYESLEVTPLTRFPKYLWSNGSTASTIQVSHEGDYWLQVTDDNNCTGRDTIVVFSKECLTGLFVPNAFTPNEDSKNDVFRARLFGVIKHFELRVYNRWGQVVFISNDPEKGWNGKVAGVDQDPAVFIWMCRYQLEGQQEKLAKGTVTLIR